MTNTNTDLVYLGQSGLHIAPPSEDLIGMVVVDPAGLRIGEVEDVVITVEDRRAQLLSVVSGGILGGTANEILVPVETVIKVDDRVHIDRSYSDLHATDH